MARTQVPPPDSETRNASYGEMSGPAERPTPAPAKRRRLAAARQADPVLVGRRRRRRTAKDGTPAKGSLGSAAAAAR